MATIKDVAFHAGVSIATVSHVINGTKGVSKPTQTKVNLAIQTLGYKHNRLASALKSGSYQSRVIAVLIPVHVNPFFSEMVRNIEQACFQRGYIMMLCHVKPDLDYVRQTLDMLQSRQIEGLLYTSLNMKGIDLLLQEYDEFPSLLIDFDYGDRDNRAFDNNDIKGGYLAARYLLSLGHRKIACITAEADLRVTLQRLEGFRKALAEFDQPYDPSMIIEGNFHQKSGFDAFMQLFSRTELPSAIIAHNDMMAFGVQSAAYQMGIRIPEDISLVGYDDLELAQFFCPPLTTIRLSTLEIANQAVSLLIGRIAGTSCGQPIHMEPQLIIRQSVARFIDKKCRKTNFRHRILTANGAFK